MAEKMPSSVKLGSRPIRSRIRWYSSGFSPWDATSSGVILMEFGIDIGLTRFEPRKVSGSLAQEASPCDRKMRSFASKTLLCWVIQNL